MILAVTVRLADALAAFAVLYRHISICDRVPNGRSSREFDDPGANGPVVAAAAVSSATARSQQRQ